MVPSFVREIIEASDADISPEKCGGKVAAALVWLQRELLKLTQRAALLQQWEESLTQREQALNRRRSRKT